MTILAFDYGGKRIGVAIKQPDFAPQPLVTLQNDQTLQKQLDSLIADQSPDLMVVGRPRNLEGESTDQTKQAEEFASHLADTYQKEVKLQDEALTSEEAETRIPAAASPQQRKQLIDQYAAVIILEDFVREATLQG